MIYATVAFLASTSVAFGYDATSASRTPAITEEMINFVNSQPHATWKATRNVRFANATVADVKRLLGTIMPGEQGYIGPDVERTSFKLGAQDIPESFDVREAWPKCASITGHVRDQSNCGSCWAFGSVEAFNDRHCITTGDSTTLFSPEDVAACCSGVHCQFSMGCNGGQPAGAWSWFTKYGVSTGGDYSNVGDGSSCKPYTLESCAHHVSPPPGMKSCTDVQTYKTPKCTDSCSDGKYGSTYSSDKKKFHAQSSYGVRGVENMQKELMEKGTLSVAMQVYEDFEAYSSGVYQHVSGDYLGGHAIKMIGWGVEKGQPYWLCVNSWNDSWGEKGTFKILRGSNECGIEGSVVAGDA